MTAVSRYGARVGNRLSLLVGPDAMAFYVSVRALTITVWDPVAAVPALH